MPGFVRADGERALVYVRVTPGASRTAVEGLWRGPDGAARLAIRVAAAPEAGKANDAVIAALAKRLSLRRSAIRIVAGASGRLKTLAVAGETAEGRLSARIASEFADDA